MDLPTGGPAADPSVRAVAALADELRRQIYSFVRDARAPVTREQAAAAVRISRKLAAFHLDKLVDVGLLRARYGQADGVRRVGRAPKVYEPTGLDVRVSIPARRYDALAGILIDAVLGGTVGGDARQAALRAAHRHGEEAGGRAREEARPGRLGPERALTIAEGALRRHGYEPAREAPGCMRLSSCPFHPLAAQAPELVCGINHAYLDGFLTGLRASAVEAALEPGAGECCVELRTRRTPGPGPARRGGAVRGDLSGGC